MIDSNDRFASGAPAAAGQYESIFLLQFLHDQYKLT